MKKLNFEEVRKIVEDKGYELLSEEYNGINSKMRIKDKDGYIGLCSLDTIKQSSHFLKFHISNPHSIYNIKNSIKNPESRTSKYLKKDFI